MALGAGHPGNYTPRVKTYSAQSGFVYEYKYVAHEGEMDGDRYRFAATQDRRRLAETIVFVGRSAVQAWEVAERRTLTPTERYAVAKLALFAALDAAEHPEEIPKPITVDASQLREILSALDI